MKILSYFENHFLAQKKRTDFSILFISTLGTLEHETGFEPAALALARRCSTTEPLVHICQAELSLREAGDGNRTHVSSLEG